MKQPSNDNSTSVDQFLPRSFVSTINNITPEMIERIRTRWDRVKEG